MATTDVYDIADLNQQIEKKYMPINGDILFMGIYGYLNEQFTTQMQNANIMAIEEGNEAIPIRAKYEKSLLTYAIQYDIDNINAIPPHMDIMIGFVEKDLINDFDNTNTFRLDRNCKIMIAGFEYHLDYDMLIQRRLLPNGNYVYTARYDMSYTNQLSDLTNPYLSPPVELDLDRNLFVFIPCTIRQVNKTIMEKKIISTNILENKTFDFEFDDQLACFEIEVMEGDTTTRLLPIFEGMPLNNTTQKYCYYDFIDSNHIRIKFDRKCYEPKLGYTVNVYLQTTKGNDANFEHDKSQMVAVALQSDDIDYDGLSMMIKFVSDSIDGSNRKSIADIKEILPKQILARETIICNKDIENFFNSLSSFNDKLYFYKKRDNQVERLYYAYMLLKDQSNNIIPTNTINIKIKESEFDSNQNARYSFSMSKMFKYNFDDEMCTLVTDVLTSDQIQEQEKSNFLYAVPFTTVISISPLTVSYYLNNMIKSYYVKYPFINQRSEIQFITTSVTLKRISLESPDYIFTVNLQQNILLDKGLIVKDKRTGDITDCRIRPYIYINNTKESYYVEGNVVEADLDSFNYTVEFRLKSGSIINQDNKIRIDGLRLSGMDTTEDTYAYLSQAVNMSIFVFAKFDTENGRDSSDIIFGPTKNVGYTLCNRYDITEPVYLFYNFSNIIQSTVVVNNVEETGEYEFTIKHIPSIRYSYVQDVSRYEYFLSYLLYRKAFIDTSLNILENSFGVDLKFFNTYGKSKLFTIGRRQQLALDKPNLTLYFDLKLKAGADTYSKEFITDEIKNYIENINTDISSLHMTNLTTDIENKFSSDIEYIEFTGINDYDALYQYLKKASMDDQPVDMVPEFLNVNLINDVTPDVNITIV